MLMTSDAGCSKIPRPCCSLWQGRSHDLCRFRFAIKRQTPRQKRACFQPPNSRVLSLKNPLKSASPFRINEGVRLLFQSSLIRFLTVIAGSEDWNEEGSIVGQHLRTPANWSAG